MKSIKMNKKGAEFTIGMLIAIVLGVLVLAVIALGFIGGWNNLWDKFSVFGGGKSTLASVGQTCQVACSSGDATRYCVEKQSVNGLAQSDISNLVTVSPDGLTAQPKTTTPGITAKKKSDNKDKNDWTLSGVTCNDLVSGTTKLISVGECSPVPDCAKL